MREYARTVLQLYPKRFRDRYGAEMLDMLVTKEPLANIGDHVRVGLRITTTTLPWIIRENVQAFVIDFRKTPLAIKVEYILSFLLVTPFMVVVTYNHVQRLLWDQASYAVAHNTPAWLGLSVILPSLSVMVAGAGVVWYMCQKSRPVQEDYEAGAAPLGSLAIPFLAIATATAALM